MTIENPTITEQTQDKIAQHRKNVFIKARLSIMCLEVNTDKEKCIGCKSYRICREVLETI